MGRYIPDYGIMTSMYCLCPSNPKSSEYAVLITNCQVTPKVPINLAKSFTCLQLFYNDYNPLSYLAELILILLFDFLTT